MKPLELGELIKGLMIVIAIALSLGKLEVIKTWAMREAFKPSCHEYRSRLFTPQVTP